MVKSVSQSVQEFVEAVVQMIDFIEIEEEELRVVRKIDRKQTKMERGNKETLRQKRRK